MPPLIVSPLPTPNLDPVSDLDPTPVFVGIDASDDHHDVFALASGEQPPLQSRFSNDLGGFTRLFQELNDRWPGRPWFFGLENPDHLLGRYLLFTGQTLFALNPVAVSRRRESLAHSGSKNDPLDARVICLLLQEKINDKKLNPVQPSSAQGQQLRGLVQERLQLVQEKVRLVNQLTVTLKGYYPRSLELFSSLDQPLTLSFLKRFPSPTALKQLQEEPFREFFQQQHYPHPSRIPALFQAATAPQVPVNPVLEEISQARVLRLASRLQLTMEQLDTLLEEITHCFDNHPDAALFRSLPGAGKILAPSLLALLGDNRQAWSDIQHLCSQMGAAPVTITSGQSRRVKMRSQCDHDGRQTLHHFANNSRRQCPWAQEFYQQQRRAGKSHATALRNLALKWLRILYRMWQESTIYDEDRFLLARERRQVLPNTPVQSLVSTRGADRSKSMPAAA